MITYLASFPRSGNTMVRIILKEVFGLRNHSKYSDAQRIPMIAEIAGSTALGAPWPDAKPRLAAATEHCFVKTHDHPEDDYRAIVIVRDPRAAIVSYWHYLNGIDGQSIPLVAVAIGLCNYGDWNYFYNAWQPQSRPNTLLLRYEDLLSDPTKCIANISGFIGLVPTGGWNGDFSRFHAISPLFFRAGNNERNISELPPPLEKLILARCAPMMSKLGYQTPHSTPPIESWLVELSEYCRSQWSEMHSNLASKERILQELAKACEDRLSLIRRLDEECRRLRRLAD